MALVLGLLAVPQGAQASFHLARIVQIFTGTPQDPDAQYVVIQAYSNNQGQFSTVRVLVFDADGTALPDFAVFAQNLPSTATNQKTILVATAEAQQLFGIIPDQPASGALPASGVICFRRGVTTPDCVAYGEFTGNSGVGGSEAGPPAAGPPPGRALHRDLGGDNVLQAADDTNSSASDFSPGEAAPGNFAGVGVSALSVILIGGDVNLSWTQTTGTHEVFKSDQAMMGRTAAPIAAISGTNWTDPDPDMFPAATFYLVKP
jgi:hypothetical protein